MFWKKKTGAVKKIEGALLRYMVGKQGVGTDVLQNLRGGEREHTLGGGNRVTQIRIFDPAAADKVGADIKRYESLDEHPELILYEGHYYYIDKKTVAVDVEKK